MLSSARLAMAATGRDRIEGEAVAGVAFEADALGVGGSRDQPVEVTPAFGTLGLAIGARMQLDHRRAQRLGGVELGRVGLDEQRDADAGFAQPPREWLQLGEAAHRIQAAFGRPLLALLRHEAGGMGLVGKRDRQHLLGRRHLQVERQVDFPGQPVDVAVGDMPAILAQMGGDAVGAGLGGQPRRAHRVGMAPASGVADGRHVIDVDPEAQVGLLHHSSLWRRRIFCRFPVRSCRRR